MPHVPYRRLVELSGRPFLVVGFLSRLPASMGQMGTLTLVSQTAGSYAAGGLAAGVLGVSTALGSPVFGALTDRYGQRRIVLLQGLASSLGFVGLVLAARSGAVGLLLVAAAVAGFFVPQVGVMARVRWRALVHRPPVHDPSDHRPQDHSHQRRAESPESVLSTAYAYESIVDELGFVLGPALVGIMVAVGDPSVAVLSVCALLLVFGSAFAMHPTGAIVPRGGAGRRGPRGPAGGLVMVSVAMFALGCLFGSLQTATTSFAGERGDPGLAGLLYALSGIGSALAGYGVPRLPAGWGLLARLRLFALLMLPLSLPLVLAPTLVGYGAGLLVLGTCMAPYMITCFTLVERVVRPEQLGAATSLLPATVNIGYAVAASVAGAASDASGTGGALATVIGAIVLMNAVAWIGGLLVRHLVRPATG
ncbi:Predicted arabinose efflux permease, MFS family [Raineyella antarctica]|uniref:Predicted arabinose efflux permease, MFS family n=1 Tax=Raineyella antarctica TaxID=1577474 RepID=A0A1G6GCX1_9ACTN|nr:MFS transporter [Raineyella antarctica]SDB79838.1 Predicted arabinose efflux permease, MFS family [Raineyella antarctica]